MFSLNCKGRMLMSEEPLVMGIVNVTPDSFYSPSRRDDASSVLKLVEQMAREGADMVDLGAQSTRPRSQPVTEEEELQRLSGIIEQVARHFPDLVVSVDTFYSRVAKECVMAGASLVNDISGGNLDGEMIPVVASLGVPYICMHMRGTPQTMHEFTTYEDLLVAVLDYFIQKINECTEAGIKDVIIDPGFGFSKTIDQNFVLLKNLQALKITDKPLLVGLSRKSTVYKTLGVTAAEALNGTTVLQTAALLKGADILRVHDVKEAVESIRLVQHLR